MFNTIYIIVLNWCGNIAFCVEGILAARKLDQNFVVQFISGLLVTFGGGAFLRDLLTRLKKPDILEPNNLQEFAIVCALMLVFWFAFSYNKRRSGNGQGMQPLMSAALKNALVILDSLGILAFAVIGHDKGFSLNGFYPTAILCGFFTACCGGILAGIVRHMVLGEKTIKERLKLLGNFLRYNRPYYAYGIVMTLTYSTIVMLGVNKGMAVLLLTPLTLLLGFLTNAELNRG